MGWVAACVSKAVMVAAAVQTMVALKTGVWQGRWLAAGDVLTVPPIEAAALMYRKIARPANDFDLQAVTPEAPARTRRRYRRRDMVAE